MTFTLKFSFFVILVCVLISLVKQSVKPTQVLDSGSDNVISSKMRFNFYAKSCPLAERIIHSTFKELYEKDNDIAPALIRMLFHDCFVHGCDASVLLTSNDGIHSEQAAIPNQSLRKFEVIDTIKSRLEESCPGVVSCADILVLAARESVFAVCAHSTGEVRCQFISPRLQNFNSTGRPDPSIDPEFLKTLRATCNGSGDPAIRMDYEGVGQNFGRLYYRSLLMRKGLTSLDQQMTSSEETERVVSGYATDAFEFQKEFGVVMAKLSTLNVLTAPMGEIRRKCSRVNS